MHFGFWDIAKTEMIQYFGVKNGRAEKYATVLTLQS